MAELEHVVKTFSLLETAEKEQPFLTREQKQDLYRIAFHKESMEEVEKIILQLQAPHAGKEEKERILYHYLEPFFQVPENILQIENYIFQLQYMTYEKETLMICAASCISLMLSLLSHCPVLFYWNSRLYFSFCKHGFQVILDIFLF